MTRPFLPFLLLLVLLFPTACDAGQGKTAHYTSKTYTIEEHDGVFSSDEDWVRFLRKTPGKDFVILNLTDIQLGTGAYLSDFDENAAMMDKVIKEVQPDLITVTGDISYGCSTAFYGICSFIDSYGIPWAPVFGNHEYDNSGMSAKTEAQVLSHYTNCLFASGPSGLAYDEESGAEAYGNYVVNIVEGSKVVKSLVFLNSMQNGISGLQMDWYKDCVESTEASSAVFLHIPVYGFTEAHRAAIRHRYVTVEQSYSDKSYVWNSGYEDSFGVAYWSYGPQTDEGFRGIMEQEASTDLIVCGHNHGNCTCIKYRGITYLYGLKTGSGYSYSADMCGGTAITVSSDGAFSVRHVFQPL